MKDVTENPLLIAETIQRDEVRWKNQTALVALMAEFGITIPAHDFANWRPTVRSMGCIPGVNEGCTILATNGLLAYFTTVSFPDENDGTKWVDSVFCGHIQRFTGDVKPLFCMPKPHKEKVVKARKEKKKSRKELLESI